MSACSPSKKDESVKLAKEHNARNFDDRTDEKEADFIVEAVVGTFEEIKLAQLAQQKSMHSDVIEIAKMLEEEHEIFLTELKGLANKKGITIPLEETDAAKKDRSALAEKSENDFNKKWCSMLADKHEKNINRFESAWKKSDDVDLRDWINKTLPALKEHQEHLKQCETKLADK
jgi:putative membrane protein